MGKAERQAKRDAKKTQKKIEGHMEKTGTGQSDGLEVNSSGDVVYNPARDERQNI